MKRFKINLLYPKIKYTPNLRLGGEVVETLPAKLKAVTLFSAGHSLCSNTIATNQYIILNVR